MNIFWVYGQSVDDGRYIDAPDAASAIEAGHCYFHKEDGPLTARYVMSSGNTLATIKSLKAERERRAAQVVGGKGGANGI